MNLIFLHFLLGFFLPWMTIGIYLLKNGREFLYVIFPFAALVSLIINQIGLAYEIWGTSEKMIPFFQTLLFDLGILPLLGTLYIYLVISRSKSKGITLAVISAIMTAVEWGSVQMGIIRYSKQWNSVFTFMIYSLGFYLTYLYYNGFQKQLKNFCGGD